MVYLSIDIETTGLNPDVDSILSIGIIVEDTKNPLPLEQLPKLHILIERERVNASIFSLHMNFGIVNQLFIYSQLTDIETKEQFCEDQGILIVKEDDVVDTIFRFLWDNMIRYDDWETKPAKHCRNINGKWYPVSDFVPRVYINVAGKNFASFDKIFLEKLPKWKKVIHIRQRIMDPGLLYVNWDTDEDIPGLSECKKRAGLNGHVSHEALSDAWDVIQLIRLKTYNPKV